MVRDSSGIPEFKFVLLLAFILLLCVLTVHKGQISGDGIPRWKDLDALMHGRLTDDKYSIVLPLLASPLYAAGAGWARLSGQENTSAFAHLFVRRYNGLLALTIALLFYLYLRQALFWKRRDSVIGMAFLLFGSMLLPHARDFYSEITWTLGSAVVLWWLSGDLRSMSRRHLFMVILSLGCLIDLNPILGPVFAGLGIAEMILLKPVRTGKHAKRLPALMLVIGSGVGLGFVLRGLENLARRGAFLDFGYSGEGFSGSLIHGLLGEFLAPARGILFFTPAVFALFWLMKDLRHLLQSRHHRFFLLTMLYCAFLVLGYAKWHGWHGAWYWGPRFMLPLSVFGALYFVVLLHDQWAGAKLLNRTIWAFIGAASLIVYKVGVSINQSHLLECLKVHPVSEFCYWNPHFMPFASLIDRKDLLAMLTSRSTAVELATILLLAALLRWQAD